MTSLLYIHGFNSSPESDKARLTRQWLAEQRPDIDFICPFLSPFPAVAMAELEVLMSRLGEQVGFIGSSMGGFYATALAEKYCCRAVLVNPAVAPWQGRDYLLGDQQNYHTGEVHHIEQQHLDELQKFDVAMISDPLRFMVLLQSGDEVLDHRMAAARYAACRLLVEQGGDHSFQGYGHHLPAIISFLTGKDQCSP